MCVFDLLKVSFYGKLFLKLKNFGKVHNVASYINHPPMTQTTCHSARFPHENFIFLKNIKEKLHRTYHSVQFNTTKQMLPIDLILISYF